MIAGPHTLSKYFYTCRRCAAASEWRGARVWCPKCGPLGRKDVHRRRRNQPKAYAAHLTPRRKRPLPRPEPKDPRGYLDLLWARHQAALREFRARRKASQPKLRADRPDP